ncbi:MAG: four helix bundle protein [Acidobacteria bacterium]|nr:four helix bundle protein [Acidobacteriota bacterium]
MTETRQKGAKQLEDLHIYGQARELTNRVYALTRNSSFARDRALQDQMRRAAVSVLSNIAEGFERGSKREFAHALTVAKGSCGELRAQLVVASDQKYLTLAECEDVTDKCRRLSAGISRLISYLRSKPT